MRQLNVLINNEKIGCLFEDNDIWSFQYKREWVLSGKGYAISPFIPLKVEKQTDGSSYRHIQWFFDNLLPEEGARELLARDIGVDSLNSFGILQIVGAESAGALTLMTSDDTTNADCVQLTGNELNQRIKLLPDIPLNNKRNKRMSIAGAQHKMLIIKHNEQFYEPIGSMPSSHILKPEHTKPDDYWQTVRNEWFVMHLADALGLLVASSEVCYFPEPAYVVERFDRLGKYPNQTRTHILDACQLLGLSRNAKYQQSNVSQLKSFANKMRNKGATALAVFKWALFNALVGNADAHLKNLSCFVSDRGYVMAPYYDLISTAIYEGLGEHLNVELSQPMGDARYLSELTPRDVYQFGHNLGLSDAIVKVQMNQVLSNIIPKAEQLIAYVAALTDIENKAGELRMLREIRYKLIGEMVSKLSIE